MTPQREYTPGRCSYQYMCFVDADGTFNVGPHGWDVTKTGVGTYVIRHGLGHTQHAAFATTILDPDFRTTAAMSARDNDTITVITRDSTQPADIAFALLVLTPE